jgi:tetratricopeptide (TPR) repeat protein
VLDQRAIDEKEIRFRLALGNAHTLVNGASSALAAPEFARALDLCDRYADAAELDRSRFNAVGGLWGYHAMRCETDQTRHLLGLEVQLAERANSDSYRLIASASEAIVRFFEGDFARSLEALDIATRRYVVALAQRAARGIRGPWRTVALLSPVYYAWALALAGRANEARELAERSVREARDLGTNAHVQALTYLAAVLEAIRDIERARETAEQIIELAEKFGYSSWLGAMGHCTRGWTRSLLGEPQEGLAEVRHGFEAYRTVSASLALTHRVSFLAEVMLRAGLADEAAKLIDETLSAARGRIEHVFDPELLRIRGECDGARNSNREAVAWFRRAAELAARTGAVIFELRALGAIVRFAKSDKQCAVRLRELAARHAQGIGSADLDDVQRALAAQG